ncbi:MAG TPA: ABC transporter permease subunit [Candidatus Lokiarchaeia archaeon]|nr:ABC transporter permease subunit [Candidatus Lokiarchaeia archaeon]
MNKKKASNLVSENRTATSLAQIGVVARYTLLDYMRSRKFTILLAIVLGLSAILILLFGDVLFLLEEFASFIALFCGIFFGSDALAGEFQNKTGFFSIPNPIRRSALYIGKWMAAFIGSSFILGIYTFIMLGVGFYYSSLTDQFGLSVIFTWFFLAATLGCVFLISSLSKSILISIFLDLALLIWANMVIQDFAGLIPLEPWFLLTYGGQIIVDILMNPYPPNATVGPNALYWKGIGGISATTFTPTVPEGLLIMGLYFVISMIVGLLFFERKEL